MIFFGEIEHYLTLLGKKGCRFEHLKTIGVLLKPQNTGILLIKLTDKL